MADDTGTDEIDGARLLGSVREALAGWPDLGSRPRVSVEQWNGFTLDELRDLLSRDRRWLDLCIGLRDHASLGLPARQALQYADPAVTGPTLDAAATAKAAQPRPHAPRLAAGSLAERYQRGDHRGDHRGVWQELGAVDPLDGTWRAEAEHVSVLTMERVRRNAERLVTALIARAGLSPSRRRYRDPHPTLRNAWSGWNS